MADTHAEANTLESSGTIGQAARNRLSRSFLTLAWLIEIIAASVGILLAVSRLSQGGTDLHTSLIGSIPFFAVAIMELTKIPLATVIFHTATRRWKAAFIFALFLSMGITFETFFIGFEQYQAQLVKPIQETKNEVSKIRTDIKQIQGSITASQGIKNEEESANSEYRERVESIKSKYESIIDGYQSEKNSVLEKYEGSAEAAKSAIKTLEKSKEDFQNQISEEKESLSSELAVLSKSISDKSNSLKEESKAAIIAAEEEKRSIRQTAQERLQRLAEDFKEDYNKGNFFTRDGIRDRYDETRKNIEQETSQQILAINSRIESIRNRIGELDDSADIIEKSALIKSESDLRVSGLQSRIDAIDKEILLRQEEIARIRGNITLSDKQKIQSIDDKIAVQQEERSQELSNVQQEFETRQAQFGDAAASVAQNVEEANALRALLAPKCNDLSEAVSDIAVYRLAMQIFAVDDVCDLTQEQLSLTQFIWFGSLSLVVSALGTTLAFAGLVIKYPRNVPPNKLISEIRGLVRRASKTLVFIQRRLTKPKIKKVFVDREIEKEIVREVPVEHVVEKTVEITKEVPVEKVVFRDVPVEIVHKELIHVPLFTQDASLLKKND